MCRDFRLENSLEKRKEKKIKEVARSKDEGEDEKRAGLEKDFDRYFPYRGKRFTLMRLHALAASILSDPLTLFFINIVTTTTTAAIIITTTTAATSTTTTTMICRESHYELNELQFF